MGPTDRQVALFRGAPREYMNVSTETPSLVSYYIDLSFHTTWVICGPDHFKTFTGEDGIKFAISDHQLSLLKVKAVSIKELLEYFKVPGAPVNIILGRDFINSYSFFFYKRTRDGYQLSKSCLNRCKWPEKASPSLEFYTASYLNNETNVGGAAAFINICSPFNIWRPYKANYWNCKESIGFFAMTQAMRIATQMPVLHPAPIVHLITSDAYTCEKFSPFCQIQFKNLKNCEAFKSLEKPLRSIVELFLDYRNKYADRTGLEELSCVHIKMQNMLYAQENLKFASQLARLGAGMSEIMFKGELQSHPGDQQYYHFDKSNHAFTIPKKQTNEVLKGILRTFQEYQKLAGDESPPPGIHDSNDETSTIHSFLEERAPPSPNPPIAQNIKPTDSEIEGLDIEADLRKWKSKLSLSEVYPILNHLKTGKVSTNERAATLSEANNILQSIIKNAAEKSLSVVDRQRHNCGVIMTGAYAMHDEINIFALKAAARLQGYLEGYFEGLGQCQDGANPTRKPAHGLVHQTSDGSMDHDSIGPGGSVVRTPATPNNVEHKATTGANRQYENQQPAIKKSVQNEEYPKLSIPSDIVSSINCRFARLANIGAMLRAKVDENTLQVNYLTTKVTEDADKRATDLTTTTITKRDSNIKGNKDSQHVSSELVFSKNTDNKGKDSNTTKLYPVKTAATALLHTKERHSRVEMQCNGVIKKKQGTKNQADGPKSTAESNVLGDLSLEHKLDKASALPDTSVQSHPTPDTHEKTCAHIMKTRKIPAKFPRGALSLANIGGVPGVLLSDNLGSVQFTNNDGGNQLRTNDSAKISLKNSTYHGVTPQQSVKMVRVSGGGIQKTLERPIISIQQALESSSDLRKTLATELNDLLGDRKFSLSVGKDRKLKCEIMCTS